MLPMRKLGFQRYNSSIVLYVRKSHHAKYTPCLYSVPKGCVCVCMCVCVGERERDRDSIRQRERERESQRERERVRVSERERKSEGIKMGLATSRSLFELRFVKLLVF